VNQTLFSFSSLSLAVALAGAARAGAMIKEGEMAGDLLVPSDKVPPSFNVGFSMFVAGWPLWD